MSASEWFATQRLSEDTFLIGEPMHVNSYLIVGSERAVLLDTGMGVANIREVVESLTDKPVLAVNSHHHFDHVGGNWAFDELAIHRLGAPLVEAGPAEHWLHNYWDGFGDYLAQYKVFREMDADLFQVLGIEMQMRELPSRFDVASVKYLPSVPTRLLDDNEVLDLGDRQLRVMHTPGHTVDSICLVDVDRRTIFTGDTIDTGPMYAHLDGASIDDYVATTRRLADDVATQVDDIFSAHGARYRSYPEFLTRVADAFKLVQSGEVEWSDTVDCFQDSAKQAKFNDFSIVVPKWFKSATSQSTAHRSASDCQSR